MSSRPKVATAAFDRLDRRGLLAGVADDDRRLAPERGDLLRQRLQALRPPGGEHEAGALARQRAGAGPADAGAGARDDRHLPAKFVAHIGFRRQDYAKLRCLSAALF